MRWTRRLWIALAAISGLVSVAAGAFGAHGLADPEAKELMRTGSTYEFMHALACFAAAGVMQLGGLRARFAPALFLSGALLFSGSLYALALGAPRAAGAVTPIGGLLLLADWSVLAWAALGVDPQPKASEA